MSESIQINGWLRQKKKNSTTKLKKTNKQNKKASGEDRGPGWELILRPLACEAET